MPPLPRLSKRERQIMDIVYRQEKASVTAVWELIPDPPSRTAVRTLLRILEEKGHLKHQVDGREFIYSPTSKRQTAGRSALSNVLNTFFEGSLESAMVAHLSNPKVQIDEDQLKKLQNAIKQARKQGR
ncbi:MAG: BlaI/MecI/CopY family transcriptional regulator [Phycisphaeraceae bacterium]|nr:BlaI/MecI/CopY family transcriptional regulator [Phycisphaeraceae bacterium]